MLNPPLTLSNPMWEGFWPLLWRQKTGEMPGVMNTKPKDIWDLTVTVPQTPSARGQVDNKAQEDPRHKRQAPQTRNFSRINEALRHLVDD